MADPVRVRPEILKGMLEHARRKPQIECCGLLAGRDGVISVIFQATNALSSATAYEISTGELFEMFRALRKDGLTHLGQYHSHPTTENVPSPKDIEMACYPDQAYFIISPLEDSPRPIRAFSIRDGNVEELDIIAALS